MVIAMI